MPACKARAELVAYVERHGPIPTVRTLLWQFAGATVFWVVRGQIQLQDGLLYHVGTEDGQPVLEHCGVAMDTAAAIARRERRVEFDQPYGPVSDRGCVEALASLKRLDGSMVGVAHDG